LEDDGTLLVMSDVHRESKRKFPHRAGLALRNRHATNGRSILCGRNISTGEDHHLVTMIASPSDGDCKFGGDSFLFADVPRSDSREVITKSIASPSGVECKSQGDSFPLVNTPRNAHASDCITVRR
jgi:hypothetical protein